MSFKNLTPARLSPLTKKQVCSVPTCLLVCLPRPCTKAFLHKGAKSHVGYFVRSAFSCVEEFMYFYFPQQYCADNPANTVAQSCWGLWALRKFVLTEPRAEQLVTDLLHWFLWGTKEMVSIVHLVLESTVHRPRLNSERFAQSCLAQPAGSSVL